MEIRAGMGQIGIPRLRCRLWRGGEWVVTRILSMIVSFHIFILGLMILVITYGIRAVLILKK